MDKQHLQDRYDHLLFQESQLLDNLYELDLEEMDIANDDHWYHIKEAKRKAGAELDAWWEKNREEYQRLRTELNP